MSKTIFDNFDNMQCICLEIQYQKFIRSGKMEPYRYVKLNRQFTVDLKQLIEFNDENPQDYRIVMRGDRKKRPLGSDRFTSPIDFLHIPGADSNSTSNQK